MTATEPFDPASRHPAVSIIIANYNGAAYLADAVASARHQTLRNVEIIISDDASTDDSVTIARRLTAEDPRIHLVTSTVTCGPAAARNRAIKLATGNWIAVL